jgi:hypothetical protein
MEFVQGLDDRLWYAYIKELLLVSTLFNRKKSVLDFTV